MFSYPDTGWTAAESASPPRVEKIDEIRDRMRRDWDARAREDASYFVAFGRRAQSQAEFFASAADVLRTLRAEFVRFPPGVETRALTALEIGCGPGRLMAPMSEFFGRVHGVDVSAEMVELARRNLRDFPNAEARRSSGSDLADFADESIDFVYSYAVFQHIPSKEVVRRYLAEANRVLRPGGVMRCQVNALPGYGATADPPVPGWSAQSGSPAGYLNPARGPDTWSGCSFAGEEIAEFARREGLRLLAMDGFETQYLWFTARKARGADVSDGADGTRVAHISSSFTADRLVPQAGRFASASLWVLGLPRAADLNTLRVEIDGAPTAPCYIGEPDRAGARQVNAYLPPGVRAGALPTRLLLDGAVITPAAVMRVIPAAPLIPRLVGVSDGVNLLSDFSIESRCLKVLIEEADAASAEEVRKRFEAALDDRPITEIEAFCVDPLARRFELNLRIPDDLPAGARNLFCRFGDRRFPHVELRLAQ